MLFFFRIVRSDKNMLEIVKTEFCAYMSMFMIYELTHIRYANFWTILNRLKELSKILFFCFSFFFPEKLIFIINHKVIIGENDLKI